MSVNTSIQWCDSSANPQAGCEGCELSSKVKGKGKETCYAELMTNRYAGLKGWPESFMKPKLFLERFPQVFKWPDLTGTDRPDKPWLNGMPRIVFLNDMGDTFTNGLPKDWLAPFLPQIAASKHQFLILTKWPYRFADFSRRYELPKNIWPGTSVTGENFLFRWRMLQKVVGGGPKWISMEPIYGDIDWRKITPEGIKWIVMGGESGNKATPCNVSNIFRWIYWAKSYRVACFVKQLGAKPFSESEEPMILKDGHGGDWNEWPEVLKVRQMPKIFSDI